MNFLQSIDRFGKRHVRTAPPREKDRPFLNPAKGVIKPGIKDATKLAATLAQEQ